MKKKIYTIAIAMSLSLMALVMVGAMTHWYASKGRRGLDVYVEARFNGSVKTNGGSLCKSLGLKKDKYVKKVTIKLREKNYNHSKSTTKSNKLIQLKKQIIQIL